MSLAVVSAILASSTGDADARGKRKRGPGKPKVTLSHPAPAIASGFLAKRNTSLILDANSGESLHEQGADALCHPASLTKIMTLYLLFEKLETGELKVSSELPVSAAAASKPPTKLGVRPGQTLAVEDAIRALVTKSANDAATVVAEALADSEEDFGRLMTRKARQLGMNKTVYRNASGLPHPEQVTTARDQALLGIAIQERFPKYYRYFSTSSFTYAGRAMRNHNKLLGRVEGVDGIKTGYTNASGFNLVTSVRRGGRHIVGVVLGGASGGARDAKMRSLIEGHIMEASLKRGGATMFASARPSAPVAIPSRADDDVEGSVTRPMLASSTSIPVVLAPTPSAAMAIAPSAGSTDPIKPVMVRTVAVKMSGGKSDMAKPAPAAAPIQTASLGPVVIPVVESAPAPAPRQGVLGVLPAALGAAGKAMVSSANASEAPVTASGAPKNAATRGGWAIQIGAFPGEAEAKKKLTEIKKDAGTMLRRADPYTEKVGNGSKALIRARFAGFDKDQAEAACKALKKNDVSCLALKI